MNIVRVSGQAGKYIDQISFFNQDGKKYGPYGGGDGIAFDFDFHDGYLVYLFGRNGKYVDQLGFTYSSFRLEFDNDKELPSTISTWRSPSYGGRDGTQFDDYAFKKSAGPISKIKEIKVWADDEIVNGIEVCYSDSECKKHGGHAGTQFSFELDDNEYVTEVHGRAGHRVDQIQFVLNTGIYSQKYGGFGGHEFTIKAEGYIASHFFGYSGKELDQIGAVFSEALPTDIKIIGIEYDWNTVDFLALEGRSKKTFYIDNSESNQPQSITQSHSYSYSETNTTSVAETHGASV